MAATPFFSNLVLECWERDRDDSDTDVNVNRAFGIVSAPAPAAAQQPQPPQPPSSSSSSQSTQLSSASSGSSSVAREYRDLRVIGSGSFGTIYSGLEIATGERVAIKVEAADGSHNMLYNEYQVYSRHLQDVPGFAKVYRWAHTKRWNYLVMQLLGTNLGTLFKRRDHRFSFDTVCFIAVQGRNSVQS